MDQTEVKQERMIPIQWEPVKDDGKHKSAEEIEHDIDSTRHQMDTTMDELGYKLHPKHFIDQFLDLFRSGQENAESTLSDIGNQVASVLRENPVPSILIGVGIGMILFRNQIPSKEKHPGGNGKVRGSVEKLRGQGEQAGVAMQEKGAELKEKAFQGMESIKEKGGSVVQQAQERAGEFSEQIRNRSRQFGENAREQLNQSREQLTTVIRDNPVGVAIAALATGVVAGLLFPSTRTEREALGEQSREMGQQVKEQVDKLAEKGAEVGREVTEAASRKMNESVQQQNPKSENVVTPLEQTEPIEPPVELPGEENSREQQG